MIPLRLGVNVDHVATVRQARLGAQPDPLEAARECVKAGADSIVCHLREDRRHIQDRDVELLRRKAGAKLNLEMGLAHGVVRAALRIHPHQVTLVPEKRQELTTEGGLDVVGQLAKVRRAVAMFEEREIEVSLFIDPDLRQVAAARRAGVSIVEIHTGAYANASGAARKWELKKILAAARAARRSGIAVAAGHGLDYRNTKGVARILEVEELNIGHAIVARALLTGIGRAVRDMKTLMKSSRR